MSPLTSAARRLEAIEELADGANEALATPVTATWRVDILRPSRQVKIRSRSRPQASRPDAQAAATESAEHDYRSRALAMWPRLDHEKLRRTRGDVMRIARLVERRTACSLDTIIGMLTREERESG